MWIETTISDKITNKEFDMNDLHNLLLCTEEHLLQCDAPCYTFLTGKHFIAYNHDMPRESLILTFNFWYP